MSTAKLYYRPLLHAGPMPSADAFEGEGALHACQLAGGWTWFSHVEVLSREGAAKILPVRDVPVEALDALRSPRAAIAGLSMDAPKIMGILNTTPDSFSDGGQYLAAEDAQAQALHMVQAGADIIDIGGESTRPGAAYVPSAEEISRTAPVIRAIRDQVSQMATVPISIDTRKADVAQAALEAGASLVNDVYAFTHDPKLAEVTAKAQVPVCVMHAQGDPEVMQDAPHYDNVLLDVYDFLEERIEAAEAAGIDRSQIIVDPGIGFGKTTAHCLALLKGIALFHSLGCAVLLGVSRKRFIGEMTGAKDAKDRVAGSVASALNGVAQGVQILRVHDIIETKQSLAVWQAVSSGEYDVS